jgi:hypothetical protein
VLDLRQQEIEERDLFRDDASLISVLEDDSFIEPTDRSRNKKQKREKSNYMFGRGQKNKRNKSRVGKSRKLGRDKSGQNLKKMGNKSTRNLSRGKSKSQKNMKKLGVSRPKVKKKRSNKFNRQDRSASPLYAIPVDKTVKKDRECQKLAKIQNKHTPLKTKEGPKRRDRSTRNVTRKSRSVTPVTRKENSKSRKVLKQIKVQGKREVSARGRTPPPNQKLKQLKLSVHSKPQVTKPVKNRGYMKGTKISQARSKSPMLKKKEQKKQKVQKKKEAQKQKKAKKKKLEGKGKFDNDDLFSKLTELTKMNRNIEKAEKELSVSESEEDSENEKDDDSNSGALKFLQNQVSKIKKKKKEKRKIDLDRLLNPKHKKKATELRNECTFQPLLSKKSLNLASKLGDAKERLYSKRAISYSRTPVKENEEDKFQPRINQKSKFLDKKKVGSKLERHERLNKIVKYLLTLGRTIFGQTKESHPG